MAGYLTAPAIESCIQFLAATYPAFVQLITLPEPSWEGRTIHALKISAGGSHDGVLYLGGVHAREIVNPDLLVSFALNLCQAYAGGTGLNFGGQVFDQLDIRLIVEALDTFVFPLVNPDGRVWVQSPVGYPMWRKNRNPNPGASCIGVDVNRNYDLLWSSGIGTSADPCSDIFKGASAFSEPETRNVRWMLDTYSNICCMIDVHSYMQLVLYPWGDAPDQGTNPSMNFMNPAYNGLRGAPGYSEYMPTADSNEFTAKGARLRDAIASVRGRVYTLEQSILLYPTTGTSDDYTYSRHFVDTGKRNVWAYTLETGTEFQPPYSEALNIINEVSTGLLQFCEGCICNIETISFGTAMTADLQALRDFRDRVLVTRPAGRRLVRLLDENGFEAMGLLLVDDALRERVRSVLKQMIDVTLERGPTRPAVFDHELISSIEETMAAFGERGSPPLKHAFEEIRWNLRHFRGRTVREGLDLASQGEPRG